MLPLEGATSDGRTVNAVTAAEPSLQRRARDDFLFLGQSGLATGDVVKLVQVDNWFADIRAITQP